MSDEQIEAMIQERGLNAPRVTPQQVQDSVEHVYCYNAHDAASWNQDPVPVIISDELKRITHCVVVLKNGYVVTGESACASMANYNREVGEKAAYDKALSKVYDLLGYELRTKLSTGD